VIVVLKPKTNTLVRVAMVEVTYNETATTCLELGLAFAADVVKEGSEVCNRAKELLFEPCCVSEMCSSIA
jgi:hypothetical protein